jgi:hypothetical protein
VIPHFAAVLAEASLAGFIAGVAVTSVVAWFFRGRIRDRLRR